MDFFVAKVDPRGKFLWVRTGGGEKLDRGYAVAADPRRQLLRGPGTSRAPKRSSTQRRSRAGGDYDLFVAKYDPRGKLVWIHSGGGPGYDYGHGIAADGCGSVFVTGAVAGEGRFAGEKLGHPGPAHVFCLALCGDGKVLWAHAAVGTGSSSGHGIAGRPEGQLLRRRLREWREHVRRAEDYQRGGGRTSSSPSSTRRATSAGSTPGTAVRRRWSTSSPRTPTATSGPRACSRMS